ncbi:MAG TPA: amidohydrolase family protein, partial [Caproicibacter sp.]|nr:amidohydrolase family protein [Caproicibacter sp.]
GAEDFIRHVSQYCRVSLAHTDADYEQAKASFDWGITHVTHLFNAMNGLNHRAPGAVGAVMDDERVRAEIICDGFHIHPAVLRTVFKELGEDRTVVISDSMRAAGLPDGVSELGGQTVYVKDGRARLADGTIAGSTTNLAQEVKNLISFGVPARQVIKSVTINPAKEIGADMEIGSIKTGKQADLVVMDNSFNIKLVIAKGKVSVNHMQA